MIIYLILLIPVLLTLIHLLQNGVGGWKGKSIEEIIGIPPEEAKLDDLKNLTKSQFMQLFYASPPPDMDTLHGEFSGVLLKRGVLFWPVKIFIEYFFGIGGPWLGKGFTSEEKKHGWGYNLFASKEKDGSLKANRIRPYETYIGKSNTDGNDTLHLNYGPQNYDQVHFMNDELRKVNDNLYIGFGSTTFFFGSLNPVPWILYNNTNDFKGLDRTKKLKNKWALVTDISNNLGKELASKLAQYGCNIIELSTDSIKTKAPLKAVCKRYGVKYLSKKIYIGNPVAPLEIYQDLRKDGLTIDILVNNSNNDLFGKLHDRSWDETDNILKTNIISLTHLTQLFLKDMKKRNYGYILQVGPGLLEKSYPYSAADIACKSFKTSFSIALYKELKDTDITITTLFPGYSKSSMDDYSHLNISIFKRMFLMRNATIAEITIKKMLSGKGIVIPGLRNKIIYFFRGFIPSSFKSKKDLKTIKKFKENSYKQ